MQTYNLAQWETDSWKPYEKGLVALSLYLLEQFSFSWRMFVLYCISISTVYAVLYKLYYTVIRCQ